MDAVKVKFRPVLAKWIFCIPEKAKVRVLAGQEIDQGGEVLSVAVYEDKVYECDHGWHQKKDKINKMLEDFKGQMVEEGQILIPKSGFRGGHLKSPGSGRLVGIDEFGNLIIRENESSKEVHSPVKGKIRKIEDGRIELEFRAREVEGKGLNEFKVWADCDFNIIEKISELNVETANGKVILMKEWNSVWVVKALVLGAKGVVAARISETDLPDVPVLLVSDIQLEKLAAIEKSGRVLLNSKKDRMLLVVE